MGFPYGSWATWCSNSWIGRWEDQLSLVVCGWCCRSGFCNGGSSWRLWQAKHLPPRLGLLGGTHLECWSFPDCRCCSHSHPEVGCWIAFYNTFWMCVWSQHRKVKLPRSCLATGRKRGCCERPHSSPQTSPRVCGPGNCPAKGGLGDLASGDQSPTAKVERRSGSSTPLHWCDNGRPTYRGRYPWNNVDSNACRWSSTESSRCCPSLRKWQEWCAPCWSSGLPADGLLASCRLRDANRGQFHPCWTRPSLRTHQQRRGYPIAPCQLLPCPARRFSQNNEMTWSRAGLWTSPASLVRTPSLEHQDEALARSVPPLRGACLRSG